MPHVHPCAPPRRRRACAALIGPLLACTLLTAGASVVAPAAGVPLPGGTPSPGTLPRAGRPPTTDTAASSAVVTEPGTGQWPLPGPRRVSRGFQAAEPDWLAGHRGVDLAGRAGETVVAVASGRVSHVGRVAGVPVVVVDHGATRTTYQPVVPGVGRGARVAPGEALGALSAAGSHCAPAACLHLGWRRGAAYLDPLVLLGGGPRPVRLLP